MQTTTCSNCGGSEHYATGDSTPANGVVGPHLLPKLSMGRFRVVVCVDCGLTRFFVTRGDLQALKASSAWSRVEPSRPLGLEVS